MQPETGLYVRLTDVRDLVIMLRALRIGLFIGTLIGMSACAATAPANPDVSGPYGAVDAGPRR